MRVSSLEPEAFHGIRDWNDPDRSFRVFLAQIISGWCYMAIPRRIHR
jgi:hypothetical protein